MIVNTSPPSITIIGAGHMATNILAGLAHAGTDLSHICITDKDPERLRQLSKQFSIKTSEDNHAAIKGANIVLLAIKPQSLADFAKACKQAFTKDHLIISILAATSISQLQNALGEHIFIRAMPNILVALSQGQTILFANTHQPKVEHFFSPLGVTKWVKDEAQLEAYTLLTGCGPGYLFFIMQSIIDASTKLGIDEKDAKAAVLQLFTGSAQMAKENSASLIELQQQVASKGGITEHILNSLKNDDVTTIFQHAFIDAYHYGQQLHSHKEEK